MGADQSQPINVEFIERIASLLENTNVQIVLHRQPPPGLVPMTGAGAALPPERIVVDPLLQRRQQLTIRDVNADTGAYIGLDHDDDDDVELEDAVDQQQNSADTEEENVRADIVSRQLAWSDEVPETQEITTLKKRLEKERGQILRIDNGNIVSESKKTTLQKQVRKAQVNHLSKGMILDGVVAWSLRYAGQTAPTEELQSLIQNIVTGALSSGIDSSIVQGLLRAVEGTTDEPRKEILLLLSTSIIIACKVVNADIVDAVQLLLAVVKHEKSTAKPLQLTSLLEFFTKLSDASSSASPAITSLSATTLPNLFTSNTLDFLSKGTMVRVAHRNSIVRVFSIGAMGKAAFGYEDGTVEVNGVALPYAPTTQQSSPSNRQSSPLLQDSNSVVGLYWFNATTLLVVRQHINHVAAARKDSKENSAKLSATVYTCPEGGSAEVKDVTENLNSNILFTHTPGTIVTPKFRLRPAVGYKAHVNVDGGGVGEKLKKGEKPPTAPFINCSTSFPAHLGLSIRITVNSLTLTGNYNILSMFSEDGSTKVVSLDAVHPQRLSINGKILLLTNRPEWVTVMLCYGSGYWTAVVDGESVPLQGVDNMATSTTRMIQRVSMFVKTIPGSENQERDPDTPLQSESNNNKDTTVRRSGSFAGITIWRGRRPFDFPVTDTSVMCHFPMAEPLGMWFADIVTQSVLCLPTSELVHFTRSVLPATSAVNDTSFDECIPMPPIFSSDEKAVWLISSKTLALHCPSHSASFVFGTDGVLTNVTECGAPGHKIRTISDADSYAYEFDRFRFSLHRSVQPFAANPIAMTGKDQKPYEKKTVLDILLTQLSEIAAKATTSLLTLESMTSLFQLGIEMKEQYHLICLTKAITELLRVDSQPLPSHATHVIPFMKNVELICQGDHSDLIQRTRDVLSEVYGSNITSVEQALQSMDVGFIENVVSEKSVLSWSKEELNKVVTFLQQYEAWMQTDHGRLLARWIFSKRANELQSYDLLKTITKSGTKDAELLKDILNADIQGAVPPEFLAFVLEIWSAGAAVQSETVTETYLIVVPESIEASDIPTAQWSADVDCAHAESVIVNFLQNTPGKLRVVTKDGRSVTTRSKTYIIEEDPTLMLMPHHNVRILAEGVACVEVVLEVNKPSVQTPEAQVSVCAYEFLVNYFSKQCSLPMSDAANSLAKYRVMHGGVFSTTIKASFDSAITAVLEGTVETLKFGVPMSDRMFQVVRGVVAAILYHTNTTLPDVLKYIRQNWFLIAEKIQADPDRVQERVDLLLQRVEPTERSVVTPRDITDFCTTCVETIPNIEESLKVILERRTILNRSCEFLSKVLENTAYVLEGTFEQKFCQLLEVCLTQKAPTAGYESLHALVKGIIQKVQGLSSSPEGLVGRLLEDIPWGKSLIKVLQVICKNNEAYKPHVEVLVSQLSALATLPENFQNDVVDYDDKQCSMISTALLDQSRSSTAATSEFLKYVFPNATEGIEVSTGEMKRSRAAHAWPRPNPQLPPVAVAYFEIQFPTSFAISNAFIGICSQQCEMQDLPNLVPGCYVFTSEGNRVGGGDIISLFGSPFRAGDVVGCGLFPQGGLYFTLNGTFLGAAFEKLDEEVEEWFPCFGVVGSEASSDTTPKPMIVNFGTKAPFLFDLTTLFSSADLKPTWNTVQSIALESISKLLNESSIASHCQVLQSLSKTAEQNAESPFTVNYVRGWMLKHLEIVRRLGEQYETQLPNIVSALLSVLASPAPLGDVIKNNVCVVLTALAEAHQGSENLQAILQFGKEYLAKLSSAEKPITKNSKTITTPYAASWKTSHLPQDRYNLVSPNVVKCLVDDEAVGFSAVPELPIGAQYVTFSISVHRSHLSGRSGSLGGNYYVGLVTEAFDAHTSAEAFANYEGTYLLPDEPIDWFATSAPRNPQGRLFGSGDVVTVQLDYVNKYISFSRNGEFIGGYGNLNFTKTTKFYPFVRLTHADASAEFILSKGRATFSTSTPWISAHEVNRGHWIDLIRKARDPMAWDEGDQDVSIESNLRILGGGLQDNVNPCVRAIESDTAYVIEDNSVQRCIPLTSVIPRSQVQGIAHLPADPMATRKIVENVNAHIASVYLPKIRRERLFVTESYQRDQIVDDERQGFQSIEDDFLALLRPVIEAINKAQHSKGDSFTAPRYTFTNKTGIFTPPLDASDITVTHVTPTLTVASTGGLQSVTIRLSRGKIGEPVIAGYALGVSLTELPANVTNEHLTSLLKDKKTVVASVTHDQLRSGDILHFSFEKMNLTIIRERSGDMSTLHDVKIETTSELRVFACVSQYDAVLSLPTSLTTRTCGMIRSDYIEGLHALTSTCSVCSGSIQDTQGYKCNVCPDTSLCPACFQLYEHPWHTFTPMSTTVRTPFMLPFPPTQPTIGAEEQIFVREGTNWIPTHVVRQVSGKIFQVAAGNRFVLRKDTHACGNLLGSNEIIKDDVHCVALGLDLTEPVQSIEASTGTDKRSALTVQVVLSKNGREMCVSRNNVIVCGKRSQHPQFINRDTQSSYEGTQVTVGECVYLTKLLKLLCSYTEGSTGKHSFILEHIDACGPLLELLELTLSNLTVPVKASFADIELAYRQLSLVQSDGVNIEVLKSCIASAEIIHGSNQTPDHDGQLPTLRPTSSSDVSHTALSSLPFQQILKLYYQGLAHHLFLDVSSRQETWRLAPSLHTALCGPFTSQVHEMSKLITPSLLDYTQQLLSVSHDADVLHNAVKIYSLIPSSERVVFTDKNLRALIRALHLVTPRSFRTDLLYTIARSTSAQPTAEMTPFLTKFEEEYRAFKARSQSSTSVCPRYFRAGVAAAVVTATNELTTTSHIPLSSLKKFCDAMEAITSDPPRLVTADTVGDVPTVPYPVLEVIEGELMTKNCLRAGKATSKGQVSPSKHQGCGYFEIVLPNDPIMCRVGWGLIQARGTHVHVGMDTHSWGLDVGRCKLYARGQVVSYAASEFRPQSGDILGVHVDIPNKRMSWTLNGKEMGCGGEAFSFSLTAAEEKSLDQNGMIPLVTSRHSSGVLVLFDPRRMRYYSDKKHAPLVVAGAAPSKQSTSALVPAGPSTFKELHEFIDHIRRQGADPENPTDIAHWHSYFPKVAPDHYNAQYYVHTVAVLEGLYATAAPFVDINSTRLSRCFYAAQDVVSKGCRFAVAELLLLRIRGGPRNPVPVKIRKGTGTFVLPQLQKLLGEKDVSVFRHAPVFKVSIEDSIAVDMGGVYRDTLTTISEEIMKDGEGQLDAFKYVPRKLSACVMPNLEKHDTKLLHFFGQMLAAMCMSEDVLSIDLPVLFWKFMISGPSGVLFADYVQGIDEEVQHSFDEESDTSIKFNYIHRYDGHLTHIRKGFLSVVPPSVISCLTWSDLQERCCGLPTVAYDALMKYVIFDSQTVDSTLESYVRETLKDMDDKERSLFLRFVTGRMRLPLVQPLTVVCDSQKSIAHLPQARTCSSIQHQVTSTIYIPKYTSLSTTRERIRSAILHGFDMDLA